MEFEWDPDKAASNLKKHGIPFDYAAAAFEDPMRLERDDLHIDYGELRSSITALIGQRVDCLGIYGEGFADRIISARLANRDEREEYWQNRSLHA